MAEICLSQNERRVGKVRVKADPLRAIYGKPFECVLVRLWVLRGNIREVLYYGGQLVHND
mgnify:CR=1 FL=1